MIKLLRLMSTASGVIFIKIGIEAVSFYEARKLQ